MALKAAIRNYAANELGLLPVGQTLASHHATRIDFGYDVIYAQLKALGLNIWASDGECPDAIVPFVVSLVANNCLDTYPVSPERYQRIKNSAATAEANIKLFVTPEYESIDEPTDY
jgi:hypothetical protein